MPIIESIINDRMYRPRFLQEWFADIFSYFWKPCPRCGYFFGGHEWGRWNYFGIPTDRIGVSKGVCGRCAKNLVLDNGC